MRPEEEGGTAPAQGQGRPYLLGDHAADLGQEVLTEELVELSLPEGGPLPKALCDLSPLFLCLAQEPPGALAGPLGPWGRNEGSPNKSHEGLIPAYSPGHISSGQDRGGQSGRETGHSLVCRVLHILLTFLFLSLFTAKREPQPKATLRTFVTFL